MAEEEVRGGRLIPWHFLGIQARGRPHGLVRTLPSQVSVQAIPIQSRLIEVRRRSTRRLPASQVHVQIAGLALALELRDLCLDGFAVATSRPFWRGMTHRFTFSSDAGLEITLVAKAVHCYAVPQEGDRKFVTGWEFMAGSAERTAVAIGQLFTAATDAPTPTPAA